MKTPKEILILVAKILVTVAMLYSIWTVVSTQHLLWEDEGAPLKAPVEANQP